MNKLNRLKTILYITTQYTYSNLKGHQKVITHCQNQHTINKPYYHIVAYPRFGKLFAKTRKRTQNNISLKVDWIQVVGTPKIFVHIFIQNICINGNFIKADQAIDLYPGGPWIEPNNSIRSIYRYNLRKETFTS